MTDKATTATAPTATKTEASKTGVTSVAIKDQHGADQGFAIDLGPADGEGDDVASLAGRIRGWSTFRSDGEVYRYSKQNAVALLNRYPYIADQLRRH